ncbi:MAG: tRNA uridine-5-carboxymethylaminomethyl(34) synthesis GTPase MnmE [Candidatus Omnitrophica bacterium]|nr:tRNA uridine-5-carboxymethylaminomethyl(34) synthesis GTPase MnmE [Candidatus Omnitrophota bacterium]
MYNPTDTIVAISTPMGEGGIGIVRLSGEGALAIADKIFSAKDGGKPSNYKTHTVHYGWVRDNDENAVDEVLLTVMRKPKTYTREDIVEIGCHGGIVPLRRILDISVGSGARLAEPGEFTLRAFLNGRIDLAQAESVLDIIRSKTDKALSISVSQLRGAFSGKIKKIRQALTSLLSRIEAEIDFPEEGIEARGKDGLDKDILQIQRHLEGLLKGASNSRIFREGVSICIFGRPNVGKSSLLNALLKKERAIVTHIPGTTRDAIEDIMDIRGIPVRIIDTAGIVEPKDLLERKALSKTRKYFKEADIILLVLDGSKPAAAEDKRLLKKLKGRNAVVVINKSDLKQRLSLPGHKGMIARRVSALKDEGLDRVEEAVAGIVLDGKVSADNFTIMANARHAGLMADALAGVKRAAASSRDLELAAFDLRRALDDLGMITGENFSDDILENIFSQFCIGK